MLPLLLLLLFVALLLLLSAQRTIQSWHAANANTQVIISQGILSPLGAVVYPVQ
jgi:hypothetical protein